MKPILWIFPRNLLVCALLFFQSTKFTNAFENGQGPQPESEYSLSGADVRDKLIHLDSLPLKSYSHYLDGSPKHTWSYKFEVQMSNTFNGMFIRIGHFKDRLTGASRSICSKYRIKFSNSEGGFAWPCREEQSTLANNGTMSPKSTSVAYDGTITILRDVRMSGIVTVDMNFTGFFETSDSDSSSTYSNEQLLIGPNRRTAILPSTIGVITFTAFKDCSQPYTPMQIMRSCSDFHKFQCIHTELFCNGDLNCPSIQYDRFGNMLEETASYDESDKRCENNRYWRQDDPQAKYKEGFKLFLCGFSVVCVFLAICSTATRQLRKRRERRNGHHRMDPATSVGI